MIVPPVEVIETREKTWTPRDVEVLAENTARLHGISVYTFVETMKRESAGFTVIDGQSYIPANGPNGREDSWGVAQIHLPSHPEITREQAQDPEWALEWAANEFKNGRASKWTEYRHLSRELAMAATLVHP